MRKMVRKWTRRTTMTVLKDDGDDNNSRVPDKTDILYHSYCNIVYWKNHKNKQKELCVVLLRSRNNSVLYDSVAKF